MTSLSDLYTIDEESGAMWRLLLGDSCERLAELPDESVDLSVYSPPFASLFTYSPSPRDLGNSASRTEFFEHYGYIIRENYRVTKPGRICAVHCQQLTTTMSSNGVIGVTDFRGEIIRAYVDAGWSGVLLLPPHAKHAPPPGYTGAGGRWPTCDPCPDRSSARTSGSRCTATTVPMGCVRTASRCS